MATHKFSDHTGEDWGEMARVYKKLTVGVAQKPITTLLEQTNKMLPFSEATAIHDNGCGPGPIISRLIQDYGSRIPQDCILTCSDFSAPMIEQVKQTKEEEMTVDPNSLWSRVDTQVLNAMDLKGIADESKSHITAGWVYFMTPDPQKCLSESRRVLKEGGVLGLSSWKDSQWVQLMGMIKTVRPDKEPPSISAEWKDVELLKGELERAQFKNVEAMEVEVTMGFESYDGLISMLTSKMPPMLAMLKDFSEAEMQQFKDAMLKQVKEWCPELPGKMYGTALVAVGRK